MVNRCKYVLKRGLNKGTPCNRKCKTNLMFCPRHDAEEACSESSSLSERKPIYRINSNSTDLRAQSEELLRNQITNLRTDSDNIDVVLKHFYNMQRVETNTSEYYKNQKFVDLCLRYPWNNLYDIQSLLTFYNAKTVINNIKRNFDKHIYGMENVKNELINIVCKLISNPFSTRNNIALYGPAGVGKTRFIKALGEILGIPVRVISLGGVKDSSFFLGHGYVYVESGPGKILQNVIDSKVSNPIIYFDELDKVSETESGKDVFSFLSFLTDPTQNNNFTDHYFYGMKFDLSKVIYVFSFNDIDKIDKILLDRLNIVYVKAPSKNDTFHILKSYCIPEIFENIGIKNDINIHDECIWKIINEFDQNFDKSVSSGIRYFFRIFEKILLEVNKDILCEELSKDISVLDIQIFDKYLQKIKPQLHISDSFNNTTHLHLYT